MLQSDFVWILNIGAWILGTVLAAKLSKRSRVILNYLFVPVYIIVIFAIWRTFIWVAGAFAGGYGGGLPLFIIPEALAYVLLLIMLGYHWTRFLAVPFKSRKWVIAMLPVFLLLMLYLAALLNSIQLRQNERIAIREGIRSCIFNSTEFQLPDMPYIACTSDSFSFDTPQKYQTKDKKNQAFHRKRRNRLTYKLSNSKWLLDWQGKCQEKKIKDSNCNFIPPPVSFTISKDVYKSSPAKLWINNYRVFNLRNRPDITFYESSGIKPVEDLFNKTPLQPDSSINTWAGPAPRIETGKSNGNVRFVKGVTCLKPKKREGQEKKYQCTAAIIIFKDDLHAAFDPIENINLEGIKFKTPVGISFSYEADNKNEIAQGFTGGETAILTYMKYVTKTYVNAGYKHITPPETETDRQNLRYQKERSIKSLADDLYDRCKSDGIYLNLGDNLLYYPVLHELAIHQSVRKEAKDRCLNPIGIERPPAADLSATITYFRKRLKMELPPLTVSVESVEPNSRIYTKPPKSECGKTREICSQITRKYHENKTRIYYKSRDEERTLPPFTSKTLKERRYVTGNFPYNREYSWAPKSSSGPNFIHCRKGRVRKHSPDLSYNCNFSYMIEPEISVYARFTTYVTPDNVAVFTKEMENVILRVEDDWAKLKQTP